jgi:hypothetical protein
VFASVDPRTRRAQVLLSYNVSASLKGNYVMSSHLEMQERLKTAVHKAILNEGRIDGTDEVALTNTDVVEALLEVAGLYASLHGFETNSPTELAFKHAMTLNRHIDRFRALRSAGKLPFRVVPRSEVN